MIPITKPSLPPIKEFQKYLNSIWKNEQLTNNGSLVIELENQLRNYLNVKHAIFVSSGTVALQIAIKALGLQGELITTPFSYIATLSSILWNNCIPVFSDIEDNTFCIDASLIESAVTKNTAAILATHIFGIPCNLKKIEHIAIKYNLKVIFDASHAFGVKLYGRSIFNFGNISTTSFNATKLFHTVEGGAIFTNNHRIAETCKAIRNFGQNPQKEYIFPGTNGKNSELHAAMGLCNILKVQEFIAKRKKLNEKYKKMLYGLPLYFPEPAPEVMWNYSYFPVLFDSENKLLFVKNELESHNIFPRRYFYPTLNNLSFVKKSKYPIADNLSKRILCLPIYQKLTYNDVVKMAKIIRTFF